MYSKKTFSTALSVFSSFFFSSFPFSSSFSFSFSFSFFFFFFLVRTLFSSLSLSLSASRGGSRCRSPPVTGFWAYRACRVSWGRRICPVSCSNSFSRCWLVARSASTSSVLACIVSNAPSRGRLSTSPGWSCILGGLALLLLVFRVDTISH